MLPGGSHSPHAVCTCDWKVPAEDDTALGFQGSLQSDKGGVRTVMPVPLLVIPDGALPNLPPQQVQGKELVFQSPGYTPRGEHTSHHQPPWSLVLSVG
jgi:hypothetical protein